MKSEDELRNDIQMVFRTELKREPVEFQELHGGRNSRVFRVSCGDGSTLVAKVYFPTAHDPRDRMGCEFHALQFLKENGIENVPTPIVADQSRQVAIYEFVPGRTLPATEIGESEVDQAVGFLGVLKSITSAGRGDKLSPASEACFSIRAILQNLDVRFGKLRSVAGTEPDLAKFMSGETADFEKLAREHCRKICRDHHIDTEKEIPTFERTLSPSDFGFHNSLSPPDGRLVFLDFEYFGWDDPAKTVSDFLLHPGMPLSLELKQRFYAGAMAAFGDIRNLHHRVRAVYPLFVLKWCAILLNEYTHEPTVGRRFDDGKRSAGIKSAQLEKARQMLSQASHDIQHFPFQP